MAQEETVENETNEIEEQKESQKETEKQQEETSEQEKTEEELSPFEKKVLEKLEASEKRLEKSEKRVGYLTRKLGRTGVVQEKTEPPKDKPKEDDFETHEEYLEKLTDWKIDQRERVRAEAAVKQAAKEKEEDFIAVIEAGPEKYPDFNEVARKSTQDGGPSISQAMVEAMIEAENPVDIAYWLGQNVGESRRIYHMNPLAAAREIGKLEVMLAGGQNGPPQRTKTKAPSETRRVRGKEVVSESLNDAADKDDYATYKRLRLGGAKE